MSWSRPVYCGWSILSAMLRHWPGAVMSFMPAQASSGVRQCAADKTHCGWIRVPPHPPRWTCHGQAHCAAGRPLTIDMFTSDDIGAGEPRFTPQVAVTPRAAFALLIAMRAPPTQQIRAKKQPRPRESTTMASEQERAMKP